MASITRGTQTVSQALPPSDDLGGTNGKHETHAIDTQTGSYNHQDTPEENLRDASSGGVHLEPPDSSIPLPVQGDKSLREAICELRLSQDFDIGCPVETVLTHVRVGKPNPQEFCRAHPNPAYSFNTAVLETKDDHEVYLVAKPLWNQLSNEIIPVQLVTAINRQGTIFVWEVKLPRSDGRWNPWNQSMAVAAETAKKSWVRVRSNMSLGAYEVTRALAPLAEPVWPNKSFDEIIEIAFHDNFIQSADHPVLKRLRGEI